MANIRAKVGARPTIKSRVGSQNVIQVLSNATAQTTKLINLSDVESTLKTVDGMILVWDLPTEKFIMTSVIDSSSTTVKGIAYFNNTTNSTLPTNGALIVSGGVGIGENLNVAGDITITGISTFSSDLDINAAVNILNGLTVGGDFNSTGITTLASSGGITTTGGDLYVGGDLYIADDLRFDEFTARNANITEVATVGTLGVTGLTTTKNLLVTGISTFQNNVNVSGAMTVTNGIYYDLPHYDGPNGVAYFNDMGRLIGASSTELDLLVSNYIFTTDSDGIPVWSSIIDGGEF
jgi:hypothetical protein